MGKVEKIMEKIIGNEQEIKELLSKESVDDLYEFFLKKDSTLTMEEFDDEVYDILENYSKNSNEEIDQNTLEQISGGQGSFLKKTLAVSLSALTIGSTAASSAFAAENHGVESSSRSGAVRSTKDKVKGKFVKIGKWFSAHKKAVAITGGALGAAAIGAIVLSVVASKRKNTGNSSDSKVQSKDNKAQESSVSNSDSKTNDRDGNGGNPSSSEGTKKKEGGVALPSSTVSKVPAPKTNLSSDKSSTSEVVDSKDSASVGTLDKQKLGDGSNQPGNSGTSREEPSAKQQSSQQKALNDLAAAKPAGASTPAKQQPSQQDDINALVPDSKKEGGSGSSDSTSGEGSKNGVLDRVFNFLGVGQSKDQQQSDTAAVKTESKPAQAAATTKSKPAGTSSKQQKQSGGEGPVESRFGARF